MKLSILPIAFLLTSSLSFSAYFANIPLEKSDGGLLSDNSIRFVSSGGNGGGNGNQPPETQNCFYEVTDYALASYWNVRHLQNGNFEIFAVYSPNGWADFIPSVEVQPLSFTSNGVTYTRSSQPFDSVTEGGSFYDLYSVCVSN